MTAYSRVAVNTGFRKTSHREQQKHEKKLSMESIFQSEEQVLKIC